VSDFVIMEMLKFVIVTDLPLADYVELIKLRVSPFAPDQINSALVLPELWAPLTPLAVCSW